MSFKIQSATISKSIKIQNFQRDITETYTINQFKKINIIFNKAMNGTSFLHLNKKNKKNSYNPPKAY